MRRHTQGDSFVFLAVLVEINLVVTLMAVQNEQLIAANSALLCVLVKVLQPLQTKLVVCPAIPRDVDNLVTRYTQLLLPGREVVLALEDDEGWYSPPYRVDAFNNTSPLLVALLHCL